MGRYSSIVQAIVTRIQGHQATGELLAGYKFAPTPAADVEGQSDFPTIRLWMPDMDELEHVAKIDGGFVLKLTFSADRQIGIVAALQQFEKLQDCLEFDAATPTKKDLSFNGVLPKPARVEVKNNFAEELSLNFQIFITTRPNLDNRGNRRRL